MNEIFSNWRTSLYGLLSWLLPFFAAFAFFTPEGELAIDQPLFKSLMVVIGGAIGTGLLVLLFRTIKPTLLSGLTVGLYWLVLNWVLDVAILLQMSGDTFGEYFADIGLRYLMMPIIATAIGAVADRHG